MRQSPPFARLRYRSRHTWLWCAALLVIALVALRESPTWAAPVTAPRNQTVPPGDSKTYLPAIYRTAPGSSREHSLIRTLEENGGFSTLLQTLDAANLTSALESVGPYTFFAPTDAAFAQLPSGALDQLLANPTGQLTQILLFHVVSGEYTLDDLEQGMQITTQQGSSVSIERSEGDVIINGGRIITPNLLAMNGIIHAIDTVILPPPPPDGPVNAGSCGGDDGCKFTITGGPSFANNGGAEMKLQLFFVHNDGGDDEPQGDYHLAIERDGQLISAFIDETSVADDENQGSMGPYNYEAMVQVNDLPGGILEGNYYFWVLDGNLERDSEVFQLQVPPEQGEIWIAFEHE